MGIYADETKDYSTENFTDVLGRHWGVYNKSGTGMFVVRGYRMEKDQKIIDGRYPTPAECEGQWTKKEWAEDAIRRYMARLLKETEATTKRVESKARNEKREELNAASSG